MRHFVNFGLLFAFTALAVSGALLFLLPFSLVTARVHIVVAMMTLVLIGLHVASRTPYFRARVKKSRVWGVPTEIVSAIGTVGLFVMLAVVGVQPIDWLIEQSYESRHRADIVRSSSLSGFDWGSDASLTVARAPADKADVRVSLQVRMQNKAAPAPTIAIWAETTAGSMIETLFVDPRIAYSEEPNWHGEPIERAAILPIWRHRYTLVSGAPVGDDADAVSGATPSHSFSLDDYLLLDGEDAIVLCVEVNAFGDPNRAFPDPRVGQPSLLYTAYLEMNPEQPYALLELTGRGSGPDDGAIHYDLEEITSAKALIDLILARVEPVSRGD